MRETEGRIVEWVRRLRSGALAILAGLLAAVGVVYVCTVAVKPYPAGSLGESERRYIPQVTLYGIEVTRRPPGGTVEVRGKIRNEGHRTLRSVTVTAYPLSSVGQRIRERSVWLGGLYGPLGLNPACVQEFSITLHWVPEEREAARVECQVTDVSFE